LNFNSKLLFHVLKFANDHAGLTVGDCCEEEGQVLIYGNIVIHKTESQLPKLFFENNLQNNESNIEQEH